jgi:hypothetical protein
MTLLRIFTCLLQMCEARDQPKIKGYPNAIAIVLIVMAQHPVQRFPDLAKAACSVLDYLLDKDKLLDFILFQGPLIVAANITYTHDNDVSENVIKRASAIVGKLTPNDILGWATCSKILIKKVVQGIGECSGVPDVQFMLLVTLFKISDLSSIFASQFMAVGGMEALELLTNTVDNRMHSYVVLLLKKFAGSDNESLRDASNAALLSDTSHTLA